LIQVRIFCNCRDAGAFTYWPSFDFGSNNATSSLGLGFYPPHVCIYDDPEVYLKQLFQIDLPKTSWKPPRKFKVVRDTPGRIALWFLVKNNLHSYGIDIDSGIKLGNYNFKNIEDFGVSTGPIKMPLVILLETAGKLSLGWLDANYSLVCTSGVEVSTNLPIHLKDCRISSVHSMLFGDTIICTITKPAIRNRSDDTTAEGVVPDASSIEYVKVELKNYRENSFVENLIDSLETEFESSIITKLIARLIASSKTDSSNNEDSCADPSWQEFYAAVCGVISSEPVKSQLHLGKRFLKTITEFKEVIYSITVNANISSFFKLLLIIYQNTIQASSISGVFHLHKAQLDFLLKELTKFLQARFPGVSR